MILPPVRHASCFRGACNEGRRRKFGRNGSHGGDRYARHTPGARASTPQPRGFRLCWASGAGLEHSQQSGDAQHRSRCVGGPPQSAVVRSFGEEIHRVG